MLKITPLFKNSKADPLQSLVHYRYLHLLTIGYSQSKYFRELFTIQPTRSILPQTFRLELSANV